MNLLNDLKESPEIKPSKGFNLKKIFNFIKYAGVLIEFAKVIAIIKILFYI